MHLYKINIYNFSFLLPSLGFKHWSSGISVGNANHALGHPSAVHLQCFLHLVYLPAVSNSN